MSLKPSQALRTGSKILVMGTAAITVVIKRAPRLYCRRVHLLITGMCSASSGMHRK